MSCSLDWWFTANMTLSQVQYKYVIYTYIFICLKIKTTFLGGLSLYWLAHCPTFVQYLYISGCCIRSVKGQTAQREQNALLYEQIIKVYKSLPVLFLKDKILNGQLEKMVWCSGAFAAPWIWTDNWIEVLKKRTQDWKSYKIVGRMVILTEPMHPTKDTDRGDRCVSSCSVGFNNVIRFSWNKSLYFLVTAQIGKLFVLHFKKANW